jgi:multicomponent Na+:H+ antiporter subunit C
VTGAHLFALSGVALLLVGLAGVLGHSDLVRRTIALNLASSGVFLVVVALARRSGLPDPVPHALVLTGLVVGVSSTALALALAVRLERDARARRAGGDGGTEGGEAS